MTQNSLVSLKASRKTLSRIPQGGLVHMKQLWRVRSQCRHLQAHTSGVMSVTGRHCSTRSFEATERQSHRQHTQWLEQKRVKKNKRTNKLTTNQRLLSQNNRLATQQCPRDSTTNSTLSNRYKEQTKTRGHPRHLCAVCAVKIYEDVSGLRHTSPA